MTHEEKGLRVYRVQVRREDEMHAAASTRNHELRLGVRRGDPTAGFNAVETLLAALGTCIITNINSLADKMHLQVDGATVDLAGYRREDPPALVRIDVTITLESPEPEEKLRRLKELAIQYGTVTNTLAAGVGMHFMLMLRRPEENEAAG
ncbi:MAG: OsmC family protein [Anaerolineae bacterium]